MADPSSSARPHGDPQPSTPASAVQPVVISRGICGRLSHWLWPGWWGNSCDAPSQPSPRSTRQPYDCKACREWHVECDHARPQCAHCYQQQLLCFYVDPAVKRKPKPKQNTTVPTLRPVVPSERGAARPRHPRTQNWPDITVAKTRHDV
ncbi:transcriptional regulator family: Fungal Specific TF [Penicillium argentinense]|uniref:Transcriptional regulator family: Fungal Specific TF n=1 Tax=Penicillium argentinense TaxID=1131581 RepID=A0A9W9KDM2_9EURO|nr:transcriptional regulator family: Fungal Specific TF [Penicillium argentinense]KAJ5102509.1 transcriptional regulator family: Fungal Specific TF [Penicillium argentinense]